MMTANLAYPAYSNLRKHYPPSACEPTESGKMLPMMLVACLAGTGGLADAHYWSSRPGYPLPAIQIHGHANILSAKATTAADLIKEIREALSPSMTELAAVFGVSRQALYSWTSGEKSPTAGNSTKLEDIATAARNLREAGFIGNMVGRRKITDGLSLLQLAQAGFSATEASEKLITILRKEASQRARMAERLAGRTSSSREDEDRGIPHLSEQG